MVLRGGLVEKQTMERACRPESDAPTPPALPSLTATPAGNLSGNHTRGADAHRCRCGVAPPPQLDDEGAQPGDAAAASRDSTVIHTVLGAATGATAEAAAAACVTASAYSRRKLTDGRAVDADMEGVEGGGAATAMTLPQLPPASTLAVVATGGPHFQRPPCKRRHCHRVTCFTVTAEPAPPPRPRGRALQRGYATEQGY